MRNAWGSCGTGYGSPFGLNGKKAERKRKNACNFEKIAVVFWKTHKCPQKKDIYKEENMKNE